jgi:hypothetical protein
VREGTYLINFQVPEHTGFFAYVYGELMWANGFPNPLIYELYWSFVSYAKAGGADNYNGASGSGVPDAPNAGTGLSLSSASIGGMIFGWTGGGSTLDTLDRYRISIHPSYTLTVTLYVNSKNLDLCLETTWKGTFCSQNPGFVDETVAVYNDSGVTQTITIVIKTPQSQYGSYELAVGLQ